MRNTIKIEEYEVLQRLKEEALRIFESGCCGLDAVVAKLYEDGSVSYDLTGTHDSDEYVVIAESLSFNSISDIFNDAYTCYKDELDYETIKQNTIDAEDFAVMVYDIYANNEKFEDFCERNNLVINFI